MSGGQVVPRSGGSGKGDIFFSAKWQFVANGLVQLPWDFELAGSVYARHGYPRPVVLRLSSGLDGRIRTLATGSGTVAGSGESLTATGKIDDVRYPNLWNVDLRLTKNFKLTGDTALQFTADAFNVFNNDVELNRIRDASSGAFNRLDEVLSPRVFRFGLRVTF